MVNATQPADGILRALSDRQQINDRNRYRGVNEFALRQVLGIESGSDDVRGFEAGLRRLIARGLIERKGPHWRLTTAGWLEAHGVVPGGERDDDFVRALIVLAADPRTTRVPNARIRATSVYESLGWEWNGLQALTMSERLDGNLIDAHVQGHDVWLKPTGRALQQYLMVVPS